MEQLQVLPLVGYDPEVGRWLWALQDVRHRYTLRLVHDLDERLVDWEGPDGQENAIGSLLYHIALAEMTWLHSDLKGLTELPPAVKRDFPFPTWEPDDTHMRRVLGVPLAEHVERLNRSRGVFLKGFEELSAAEWRRLRPNPQYSEEQLTPEWVVFHLVEHEAGHAFQISALRARGTRMLAAHRQTGES